MTDRNETRATETNPEDVQELGLDNAAANAGEDVTPSVETEYDETRSRNHVSKRDRTDTDDEARGFSFD